MNRIKMFLIAVISVLLIIILANSTLAADEKLTENGKLSVDSTRDMYGMDNVFCVEHGQNCGDIVYTIKASAHIRGDQLTLKRWKVNSKQNDYKDGTPSKVQTFDANVNGDDQIVVSTNPDVNPITVRKLVERSNKLAAIFYTSGLKSGGNDGFGTVTGEQLTLWYYWNTWVNSLPEDGTDKGKYDWGGSVFKTGAGNRTRMEKEYHNGKTKLAIAEENMDLVDEKAKAGKYSLDLYYLDCPEWDWQALVLIDKPEDTINIPVQKVWEDGGNRDGKRPSSINAELYRNGEATGIKKLLNAKNNWKNTFYSLPKHDSAGNLITYTVKEYMEGPLVQQAKEDGYTMSVSGNATDGFIITNSYTPERVKLSLEKKWDDMDDLDEYRPESITVKVRRIITEKDGTKKTQYWQPNVDALWVDKKADGKSIVLNEANNWKYAPDTKFYKYYKGTEIEYSFVEVDVPDQYTSEIVKGDAQTIAGEKWQVIPYTMTNTHKPNYDGYIEITGKVWEDRPDGKANNINGILEDDESGLGGIKVILKDANGNAMASTYTDKDGKFTRTDYALTKDDGTYTIRVNYDNSKNVYKLYEDVETVKTKLNTAYVEFEYDGNAYTTVKNATTGTNTSRAIENETTRNNFDETHSTTEMTTAHPDEWTDKAMTATTKNVIKSFDDYMNYTNNEVKENFETKKENVTVKYCQDGKTYIRTNPEGAWEDIIEQDLVNNQDHKEQCSDQGHSMRTFDIEVGTIKNVNLGLFKREQPDVALRTDINKVEVIMNQQKYTYIYGKKGQNIESDVKVQFQNKGAYTYRRPINPADIAYINEPANVDKELMEVYVTYTIKLGNLSSTLPITVNSVINAYDSDYTVQYIAKGKEYFESQEGLAQPQSNIANTSSNVYEATDFNEMTLTGLNIKLQPLTSATEANMIYIKYKVSADEIRRLLTEESSLHNASEIASYTTCYGENTLYAEQGKGGRTNQPYGGYDYNSHPGNAAIERTTTTYTYEENGNIKQFENVEILVSTAEQEKKLPNDEKIEPEDDTDIAPSFILHKDEERTFSGNLWVDTDVNADDDFRIGNGIKDENELNLANAKVELYRVNADGTPAELAKLRHSNGEDTIDAVTYSDADGNYKFGNDEYGVVTDRYLIKFTYGEGIDGSRASTIKDVNVSARNYKSTIINEGTVLYQLFKGENDNDEWHLNIGKGYSIAVDDMEQRVTKISDLQYSTFGEAIYIDAYSKPFEMQVEFDPSESKTSQVGEDGKTAFGRDLNVFDFGIVERAREDIYTEKTIENIKITLANGQILLEGNPKDENLSYVKPMGEFVNRNITNSEDARKALGQQLIIEMDAELIQGAQLDMKYAVKITNHSEKEYDYYIGDESAGYNKDNLRTEYYIFGTNNENSPVITSAINGLVDYVDSDLSYKWENESDWQEIAVAELASQGLVSQKVNDEALNTGKYKAYITSKYSYLEPGQSSEPEYAFASRLLSNKDEDESQNVFENHVEILKIDAKTGRTIKGSDDSGVPIAKQYKTGNYIPSLEKRVINTDINNEQAGLHEQDDDRVKVTITPPTGLIDNAMTYVMVGLVSLIIVVVGVVIIKKKVLTK